MALKLTVEIGAGAEGSPNARDYPDPQALVLVEPFPDFSHLSARRLVDAVQLVRPVDGDLHNSFLREGHFEMLELEGSGSERHLCEVVTIRSECWPQFPWLLVRVSVPSTTTFNTASDFSRQPHLK